MSGGVPGQTGDCYLPIPPAVAVSLSVCLSLCVFLTCRRCLIDYLLPLCVCVCVRAPAMLATRLTTESYARSPRRIDSGTGGGTERGACGAP